MTTSNTLTLEEAFKMATDLHNAGRLGEAKAIYLKLIESLPKEATLYSRLGAIFDVENKLGDAIAMYAKAVEINPNYAAAHYNLANAYRDMNRFEEALPHYRKVLEVKPEHDDARASLFNVLQNVCGWDELEKLAPSLDAATKRAIHEGKLTAETPFIQITRCDDQAKNLAVANSWAESIKQSIKDAGTNFSMEGRKVGKKTLTVGYLSREFQDQPTGQLLRNLFSQHDRDKIRVNAYSYGPDDGSEYRKTIREHCNKFADIKDMNDIQAAQTIYDDQVDILIDTHGHLPNNRLKIAALRPAPIQVSYPGYPGSIGGKIFDYLIADQIGVPPEELRNFTERMAYMPGCYQMTDGTQAIDDGSYKRGQFGLPEDVIVFCSFNWSYQLDEPMFRAWMQILKSVPDSVLWLSKSNALAEKNLCNYADKFGVRPERLIFASKTQKTKHLAQMKLADIALDTRVYGGHTTAADALWAGVPLVTLQGNHFASRISSSLLTSIGLPDLVTENLEQYKDMAIELATDTKILKALTERLKNNRETHSLFDTQSFVGNLEGMYQAMWNAFCCR